MTYDSHEIDWRIWQELVRLTARPPLRAPGSDPGFGWTPPRTAPLWPPDLVSTADFQIYSRTPGE